MAAVSFPVTRPVGRALIIGTPGGRQAPLGVLQRLGFSCAEAEDPYRGMAELCRRPLQFRAVILSLNSLYREELTLISAIKRRFPHLEIWLTQIEGRQAALAEAMRLGADGLLSEEGLHRTATGHPAPPEPAEPAEMAAPPPAAPPTPQPEVDDGGATGEPLLTADELRALLQEPDGGE